MVGLSHERGTGGGVRGRGPRCFRCPRSRRRSRDHGERRAALRKLQLAYQWAVLHPATHGTGVATHGGPALEVLNHDESLGGDGTPAVAAFTPETFAARLGISPGAGAQLIADALDLRHRLPLLWKRVARSCRSRPGRPAGSPSRPAASPWLGARWVDQRLALRVDGALGPVITDRLVALAVAKFDPEEQEQREALAEAGSEVTLSHPNPTDFAGTSDLMASGDTLTLKAFYDLVCAIAHQLHLDGDPDPLGVRKIKAIGLITALATGQAPPEHRPHQANRQDQGLPPRRRRRPRRRRHRPGSVRRGGGSSDSAPPPWPSSDSGSVTPRSSSNPC